MLTLDTLLGLRDDPATINGRSVPADIARELATGTTALRRLVTDPVTGHLLDYGTTREPPTALAEFLLARDRECRVPHCHIRASACDLDHATPWAQGGTSSSANMGALSRGHHTSRPKAGPTSPFERRRLRHLRHRPGPTHPDPTTPRPRRAGRHHRHRGSRDADAPSDPTPRHRSDHLPAPRRPAGLLGAVGLRSTFIALVVTPTGVSGLDAEPLEDQLADPGGVRLTLVAFMTAPMTAPAACTLPSRIFSSTSGWAASAASIAAIARRRPTPRGRGRRRPLRAALARDDALEHLARELVVQRAGFDERLELGDIAGVTRSDGSRRRVRDAGDLARPPLAGGAGRGAGGDRRLDRRRRRR